MQIGDAMERLQCIPSVVNTKQSQAQGLKITGNVFIDVPIRIRQVSYTTFQLTRLLQGEVLSLSVGDEKTFASDLPELKNRQE